MDKQMQEVLYLSAGFSERRCETSDEAFQVLSCHTVDGAAALTPH